LTEPETSILRQQKVLLETEGVKLEFTDRAVKEMARVVEKVNRTVDNIGARLLYTVLERILEEISFNAPELANKAKENRDKLYKVVIDKEQVVERVGELLKKTDLSRYTL